MNYETMTLIAQMSGMFFCIALFVAVLAYALWPSNWERFERAAGSALRDDRLED